MVAELPPLWFKTTGSLASLRRLMGWQALGLACKVKSGAVSLANMRSGDFIFFAAYALAGLVPPLSSFFLTLLEYYRLQLQHLSPNSITLVAIFVHLCEMYVGVRPSVQLFRCFFVMNAMSTHPPLIGGHYFQRRTPGHACYIAPVSPDRWERWRGDWALVQADVHDRLALPVSGPTLDHTEWGKDPGLEPGFNPVLDQILYLAENGLTSLMVLHDFLSKHLAPLKDRSHFPAWMYTGVNDIMRLDRGPWSSLGDTLLAVSLKALTTDSPSAELITPVVDCEPLCVNQAARTALLAIMPTLDDVDIAPVQRGDQSRGVVIPGPDGLSGATGGHGHGHSGAPTGGRGGAVGGSSVAAPGKGKQTRVILDDDEVLSDEDEPLQKRLRQLSGVGPAVHDEAAVADKEATDKRAVEEAMAKKATEEAAAKRVVEEAMAKKAVEETAVKRAVEEATVKRATEEAAVKKATEERAVEEAAAKAVATEAAGAADGLTGSRPSAIIGRGQEACGSEWLHLAGQMSLHGCLETSVCPALSPLFLLIFHSLTTLFCPDPHPPARPW
jgi:hypothetical protein